MKRLFRPPSCGLEVGALSPAVPVARLSRWLARSRDCNIRGVRSHRVNALLESWGKGFVVLLLKEGGWFGREGGRGNRVIGSGMV